jgi:Mu-like prophage I protein
VPVGLLAKNAVRLTASIDVSGEVLPTEFQLFQAGLNETSKGTLNFTPEIAAAVMAEYDKQGVDLMVDLEHLSLDAEAVTYDPDARAWYKLELRNGALWAVDVRWTPDGARRLTEKTQRYISPAYLPDASGGISWLVNAALCAMPATYNAPALVAASRVAGARRLAAGVGSNELREALSAALTVMYPPADQEGCYINGTYVEDIIDNASVVFSANGKLMMAPFTYQQGATVIGTAVAARRTYAPVTPSQLTKHYLARYKASENKRKSA